MTFVMGKQTSVEFNGVDLTGFVTDSIGVEVTPWQRQMLDVLPDVHSSFSGYWDAPTPGLGSRAISFSVPWSRLHPATRRLLLAVFRNARNRRLSRMHSAYRRRRRR